MQRDDFWHIVEAARAEADDDTDAAEVADVVVDRLASLPLDEIVAFGVVLGDLLDEAYRWELWAAAYLINDGCSDDGFTDFRGWLITQGRAVWENAVADPDSLAAVVTPDLADTVLECEDMIRAAHLAHERVTGDDEAYWGALDAAEAARNATTGRHDPQGDDFDFDDEDEMQARLPRLAAQLA